MDKKKLSDQIWCTRISRVNAEKRLLLKEKFIQAINVYYSCILIVLSVLTLNSDSNTTSDSVDINTLLLCMTIVSTMVILYLNSQNYSGRADKFKKNYTELQRIEFELDQANKYDKNLIGQIENKYCDLIKEGENHIEFDYLKTIKFSNREFKKNRWNKRMSCKYLWYAFIRSVIAITVILFPFIFIKVLDWMKSLCR